METTHASPPDGQKNHGESKAYSLTRPTTHAAISTFSTSHNAISSPYSQPFTSLAAPKANPIFHAANKKLIHKNTFRLSPSYFFILLLLFLTNLARGLTTLSEETTQRKHPGTLQAILAYNKLSLATNKPTSSAKIILQKKTVQIISY